MHRTRTGRVSKPPERFSPQEKVIDDYSDCDDTHESDTESVDSRSSESSAASNDSFVTSDKDEDNKDDQDDDEEEEFDSSETSEDDDEEIIMSETETEE